MISSNNQDLSVTLQLEDIYGSLFLVQCDNKLNREKHRLGEKQSMFIKFCSGVLLFAILIAVIWAPMLVFISPFNAYLLPQYPGLVVYTLLIIFSHFRLKFGL